MLAGRIIAEDRALLGKVATLNQSLGEIVMHLLNNLDEGELPAGPLREIAAALESLAGACRRRADARDATIDGESTG